MKQLSIIVPVYNVERYVCSCIESIYNQGLDENIFELIIINDGSKDRSMEMIDGILKEHSNITVVNQENQGLSVARNNGIEIAKGKYILMPDSDDLLINNSLSILLEKAIKTNADIIVADFLEMEDSEVVKITDIQQKINFIKKTGQELLIEDLNPFQCYVWRSLFKRDFLIKNCIRFIPGICYQDVPFTHECYLKANNCLKSSCLLNIYRKGREDSATFSFSKKKALDISIAIGKTWELRNMKGLSEPVICKLKDDVFTSFRLALWWISQYIHNASDREDCIKYLKENASGLNFTNGLKQRMYSIIYRRMPYLYINVRYYIQNIKLYRQ